MLNFRLLGIIVSIFAIGLLGACDADKGSADPAAAAGSEAPAAEAVSKAAETRPQEPMTGAVVAPEDDQKRYSAYVGYSDNVYFGDTHIHSTLSADASLWGSTKTPEDIYAFSRGEGVISAKGWNAKLIRPLDFVAIADHSDAYGFYDLIAEGSDYIVAEPQGARWHLKLRIPWADPPILRGINGLTAGGQ
jgi:hypothetical protein